MSFKSRVHTQGCGDKDKQINETKLSASDAVCSQARVRMLHQISLANQNVLHERQPIHKGRCPRIKLTGTATSHITVYRVPSANVICHCQ